MADYRRAARELALRALFQADVGHQPIRQALEGAMEQLAASVRSGLLMAVRQTERALRNRPEPRLVLESQTTKRERRRVHGHVHRKIARCAEVLTDLASQAVRLRPTQSVQDVLSAFPAILDETLRALRRVLAGSTLAGDELRDIEAAIEHAQLTIRRTLEKRLPIACDTAAMLKELAVGAWTHREVLDERLRVLAQDWPLERQSAADRNILRLAAFELLYRPDTPPAVAINEAVELAKRYGSDESGRFVNGVLAALAHQISDTGQEASP